MKRRYRRYFIMLELEDKNFEAFVNEKAKGYAKVEIKGDQGLLAIYCQNLRSSSDGNRYRWYLINTNTDKTPTIVEIGPMEVDEKGKGEIVCEFNTENVKGSMEQIDNFEVLVLVARNKDDKDKLCTPLVGYIDKEKPSSWRYALGKYLYIPLGKENVPEEKTVQPYQSTEEVIEEVTEEVAEEVTEEVIEKVAEEITEEVTEEVKEEIKEEYKEEVTEEVTEEITEEAKEEIKEEYKNEASIKLEVEQEKNSFVETEKDEYEVQMQAYIENSLSDFPRVEPFVNNLENYIWWQIPYGTETTYRAYMPFILYLDSLKESTSYYISKMLQIVYIHQHHIFGVCYDENNKAKYYAYGIPGRNLPLEQPFEIDEGFTYWHPCNDVPINIESHGYWILKIDPKTGDAIKDK